jgi:hypothetical protein
MFRSNWSSSCGFYAYTQCTKMIGVVSSGHNGFWNAHRSMLPTWNETAGIQVLITCKITIWPDCTFTCFNHTQFLTESCMYFACDPHSVSCLWTELQHSDFIQKIFCVLSFTEDDSYFWHCPTSWTVSETWSVSIIRWLKWLKQHFATDPTKQGTFLPYARWQTPPLLKTLCLKKLKIIDISKSCL